MNYKLNMKPEALYAVNKRVGYRATPVISDQGGAKAK